MKSSENRYQPFEQLGPDVSFCALRCRRQRDEKKFVAGDVVKGRYRVRFVARGDAESQEGR